MFSATDSGLLSMMKNFRRKKKREFSVRRKTVYVVDGTKNSSSEFVMFRLLALSALAACVCIGGCNTTGGYLQTRRTTSSLPMENGGIPCIGEFSGIEAGLPPL